MVEMPETLASRVFEGNFLDDDALPVIIILVDPDRELNRHIHTITR